ncbi:MAG TPA: rhodanese-like domain-containing protein [Luteolibacter sp.]|nr:rhodanese-like domain-containing protein [Luteolibacter sp.]
MNPNSLPKPMKIQAKQVHERLQSGTRVALIDVRTPVEHEEMHIAGSRLMPLDQLDPALAKAVTAGAESCVVICRSGKRAEQAVQKLRAAGCENLAILDGGVLAWESAGLPLEHSSHNRLPLMRQVQLIIGLLALTGSVLALTVNKNFALLPAFLGAGLTMAGATGWCGLAILLSKMPWNKVECGGRNVTSCSV